jgi:hypothetical protein
MDGASGCSPQVGNIEGLQHAKWKQCQRRIGHFPETRSGVAQHCPLQLPPVRYCCNVGSGKSHNRAASVERRGVPVITDTPKGADDVTCLPPWLMFTEEQTHYRCIRSGRYNHLAGISRIQHPYNPAASARFLHNFVIYEFASTAIADCDQRSS